jgi:hypothetical protein
MKPAFDRRSWQPYMYPNDITKEEILDNHWSILCSFGISTKDEELDLPSLLTCFRDNTIFVMKERQVFSNIRVGKDWCRPSFVILICTSDVLGTLEEGDLVEFPRGIFSHWGVYVGMYQCPLSSCIILLAFLFSHFIRIQFRIGL